MPAHVPSATSAPELVPEFRLLLACTRKTLRPVDAERMVGLCREPLDWPLFLRLVARHRVAPLVWQSLKSWQTLKSTGSPPMPDQIRADLRQTVETNTLNALRRTAELVRLMRRFETAGIRVLPLKGPVLALQAYGALKLRHAGDLDLLVDPASVRDADRLLKDGGYLRTSPEYPLSPGQAAAFMRIRKDFSYIRAEGNIHVELHWRLSQNAYLMPLGLDELWPGRESVRFGSDGVAAMPRQELLLYLCAHGAHTGWFRLKWLADIAELAGDGGGIDMSKLIARAHDLGATRMLVQGLLLAHQMLDLPLPAVLSAGMRQDRTVQSLVRLARRALQLDERYWSTDNTPVSWMPAQARYRLKLRADLRYKWHNVYSYSLWTDDLRRIRLPDRLCRLYFVLAPFSGIVSLVRRYFPANHGRGNSGSSLSLPSRLPSPMSPFEQYLQAAGFIARHLAAFALIAASCWVFGETLLDRIAVDRRPRRGALAGALGLGLIAQALFLLGVAGWLDRGVVLALLFTAHAACFGTWRAALRAWRSPRRRRLAGRWLALAGPVFALFFWLTLYPPTEFDATLYHLPYARSLIDSGSLPFLPDLRYPVFPQVGEMGFVLAFFLAGDVAAKLTQLLAMLLTAGLLIAWGRRSFSRPAGVWAAALWLGNPVAVWLGTSAYIDATLALFVTAALYAWERWSDSGGRRWLGLAAAFVGLAAGTKYLGLFFLAALALFTAARGLKARDLRPLAIFLAVAVAALAPWYLRIVYHTGNPVFPFYSSLFGPNEWARTHIQPMPAAVGGGAMHNARAVVEGQASRIVEGLGFLLRVPWTAVFDRGVFHWQAPLSPLYLVLLPLCAPLALFDARSRRLVVLTAVYALFWLTTHRDLRYLLACAPALDLALAATLARGWALAGTRWRRVALPLVAVGLASPGVFWAGYKVYQRGPLPVTAAQRVAYLERAVSGFAAVDALNQRYGAAYVVYALHGENLRFYAEGRFLGDWFGPARFSQVRAVLGDGEALFSKLRQLDACHFLLRHRRLQARLPDDDFFRRHFELSLREEDYALYRLIAEGCPPPP